VTAGAPYVGLDYFGEEDAGLFFGRDAERKRIISNLRASRLTLLYAESGVGKSSLLRAGVAARLRQMAVRSGVEGAARYIPVVFSTWRGDSRADLIAALEAAAQSLMQEDTELALPRDALEDAIQNVVASAGATPLLILDHFEERVLYEPDDEFDDELAHCINRRDLRANFLFSVREDAYSLIGSRFKARIANVYGNYLHLDYLDEQAARDAIVEPVHAFNRTLPADAPRYEVETALVDALLEQVRRGRVKIGEGATPDVGASGPVRVDTAYLQLVMRRLWDEEVAGGSQRLRLETLQRLGGADTIVHGHLGEVMGKLPADQREAAAVAFRFLVTSGGRKIALSSEELREFSDAPAAPLEPALEHLNRERILRPCPSSEPGGVARHEIYHDVLAPAILEWRRRHLEERTERGLAQARERARRLEVRNRRLAAALVALTAVAVALALYVWDPVPMQKLELRTVDSRFSVRGAQALNPRLVLIAVDDRTLERLHATGAMITAQPTRKDAETAKTKLRRDAYASLLDRLRQDRPAVLALDVIFLRPWNDRQQDRALLQAVRATRDRLVLPFKQFDVVSEHDKPVVQPTLFARPDALRGVRTGFAGLPEDRDDHNRRVDYKITTNYAGADAETFAFAAADVTRGGALRPDRLPTASQRAWGGQSGSTAWIDFRGPPGKSVRRVSALDVIDGRVPPGAFTNKVVVIAVTTPRSDDPKQQTPLDGGRRMIGPELQANAIDTILRGVPLRDASWLIGTLAILVLACLPALASLSASRFAVTAVIVGLATAFFAVAQIAFNGGWIIPVVVPLAALAASATGVAVLVATRTLRRRRLARARTV
jgi:CHASE2 domain-containing sensor protein